MKRHDRVLIPAGHPATVIDLHRDKTHVSVLPDPPLVRALVRFELHELRPL